MCAGGGCLVGDGFSCCSCVDDDDDGMFMRLWLLLCCPLPLLDVETVRLRVIG